MRTSTITSKGQLTIPKAIRDMFGLEERRQVVLEPRDGYIVMRPVDSSLDRFAGSLPSKKHAASKRDERRGVARVLGQKNEPGQ